MQKKDGISIKAEIRTLAQKNLEAEHGNELRNKSRVWQEAWMEGFEEGFRQGIILHDLQIIKKKIQKVSITKRLRMKWR